MNLKGRLRKLFSFFKRKPKPQESVLVKVGALTMMHFHKSRKLRRKIKDTAFEYDLMKILRDENK